VNVRTAAILTTANLAWCSVLKGCVRGVELLGGRLRSLREELSTLQDTTKRVAGQLEHGFRAEPVGVCVQQAETNAGLAPGLTSADKVGIDEVNQAISGLPVYGLRSANATLCSSVALCATDLDRSLR
jgi:hypothetical protein